MDNIFNKYQERYEEREVVEMSVEDYLQLCKEDPMAYATMASRMLLDLPYIAASNPPQTFRPLQIDSAPSKYAK